MTAWERIELLAPVAAQFPELGAFGNAVELKKLVSAEWPSHAIPPVAILHIISANTAMAGMQSLIRGLILGSRNWCKTPGAGLPRFLEMVGLLPSELRSLVEISATLPGDWLEKADAVIVFGNDQTVAKFRSAVRPDQIFAGYGQRWSGAVIYADSDFSSIPLVVRDICLYEQMGCLSAQIVWLHEAIDPTAYATRLAAAMERFVAENKIAPLDLASAASVARWRLTAEWKAVANPENRICFSPGEPVWGVFLTDTAGLSCLHRHVSLQSFSGVPDLGELAESVSTLGIWPADAIHRLAVTGATRICSVGELQFPLPSWQQDGFPALGRLLRKKAAA